ncbi:hypothetical protein [Glycomyces dulcitolivorans]|nr:hypothetical protein [Glycomyces dulcitolivorans]
MSLPQHLAIVEAIRRRDPAAEAAMRARLRNVIDALPESSRP